MREEPEQPHSHRAHTQLYFNVLVADVALSMSLYWYSFLNALLSHSSHSCDSVSFLMFNKTILSGHRVYSASLFVFLFLKLILLFFTKFSLLPIFINVFGLSFIAKLEAIEINFSRILY